MLILYQQVHQGLPCRSAHPPQASARGNGGRRCAGRVLGRGGAGARHHWLGSR